MGKEQSDCPAISWVKKITEEDGASVTVRIKKGEGDRETCANEENWN